MLVLSQAQLQGFSETLAMSSGGCLGEAGPGRPYCPRKETEPPSSFLWIMVATFFRASLLPSLALTPYPHLWWPEGPDMRAGNGLPMGLSPAVSMPALRHPSLRPLPGSPQLLGHLLFLLLLLWLPSHSGSALSLLFLLPNHA